MENYKVYPKQQKNINGLNQEQLKEAMILYTDHVKEKIINNLEQTFNVRLDIHDFGETLSYFHYAIELAMIEGTDLAINRNLLTEFYENKKGFKINPVTHYDFQLNMGVSGVLTQNGEFLMCGNAEHHLITENLNKEDLYRCIYFSSTLLGNDDGVISIPPIKSRSATKEQNNWIENNKQYFDNGQTLHYNNFIETNIFKCNN